MTQNPFPARTEDVLDGEQSPTSTAPSRASRWYQREKWLVVCLVSALPTALAFPAPQLWKLPLVCVTGALLATSMVMLVRRAPAAPRTADEPRRHRSLNR